nr:hypothetical protein BgiMline_016188 [Biomphalaria glabrata]
MRAIKLSFASQERGVKGEVDNSSQRGDNLLGLLGCQLRDTPFTVSWLPGYVGWARSTIINFNVHLAQGKTSFQNSGSQKCGPSHTLRPAVAHW